MPEDTLEYDGTCLPYDWYDVSRSGGSLNSTFACSSVILPKEKAEDGAPYLSRNYDFPALVLWTALKGGKPKEGAWGHGERPVVLEYRPDHGYKSIISGVSELLTPWVDGINEKGLYVTVLRDPQTIGTEMSPAGGGNVSGLSGAHLPLLLLSTCATVAEAKQKILENRITQTIFNFHLPIADAEGNATVLEVDKQSGAYVFTDRQPGEPLFTTNYPVHLYPTPDTYPETPDIAEHNPFTRQRMLRDAYDHVAKPLKLDDASNLTDLVRCSFIDWRLAEAGPAERTLSQVRANLAKPEMSIRWYFGDQGPVEGTNHMANVMSEWQTFRF